MGNATKGILVLLLVLVFGSAHAEKIVVTVVAPEGAGDWINMDSYPAGVVGMQCRYTEKGRPQCKIDSLNHRGVNGIVARDDQTVTYVFTYKQDKAYPHTYVIIAAHNPLTTRKCVVRIYPELASEHRKSVSKGCYFVKGVLYFKR